MRKFLKFIIFFLIILIILALVITFFLNRSQTKNAENLADIVDLELLSETVGDSRENILLLGVDSLDGSDEKNSMRTDTMMVLSVDPKTKTGYILSIPRDTRVKMEGTYNKINAAHSHGGVKLTLQVIKDNIPIPINHYVKVDYKAVYEIVDAIGGVDIDVPMDMHYEDPYAVPPLVIDLKKGYQTLDSQKSMQFLRFRKGYINQDLGRINAQQEFMKSMIKKVLNKENIIKLPKYIEVFHNYVDTDMSIKEMFEIGAKLIKIKPYNIRREVIPGVPKTVNNIAYFIMDEDGTKKLINVLKSGDYYSDKPPVEEIEKKEQQTREKNYSITVLNGSGIQGRAQRAYDLLKLNSLTPKFHGNAEEFNHNQTIIYTTNDELGKKIIEILGTGIINTEQKMYNNEYMDGLIILGKDFDK